MIVYNNLGQLVLEKDNLQSNDAINLEQVNSGIYFYKIICGDFIQTGKIGKE